MVTQKRHNFKITLPLIALCIPLFANHSMTTANGCPFETFLRVNDKCLDISQQGLQEMTTALGSRSIKKVDRELQQVSQELTKLKTELVQLETDSVQKVDREIEQVNQELAELNQELAVLNSKSVTLVEGEIQQVSQKLLNLSQELEAFCTLEQPDNPSAREMREKVCQD